MAERRIVASYQPLPPQAAFRNSQAKVRGYGGAMAGGKTRALCEEAFDLAIEYPGIVIAVCRLRHTSIIETTKRTMTQYVIPPELLQMSKRKESGGEDFLRLPNGSTFHFIGLEDPVKWFSSELGALVFDEAHEIDEQTVVTMMSRLRQVLPDGRPSPGKVMIGFNPENPGHWLHSWFIRGAGQTKFGYYKPELYATGATKSNGDAEFVIAKATDNPHLPPGYIDTVLSGLPDVLRRRYLDGEWLFISGTGFFDADALLAYRERLRQPRWVGVTQGDTTGKTPNDPCKIRSSRGGPWQVWEAPVRERYEDGKKQPAHRYIVSVDVSSGTAADYSGIQVVDVDTFEQVAEYQAKVDPDLLAVEAFRIAAIYNSALVAPEVTGGWGFTIVAELKRLMQGLPPGKPRPRLYTRRIRDRLSDQFTTKLGWDTNTSTRMVMLDTLERVLREGTFGLYSERTLLELANFVRDERGRPAARPNCTDDLVVGLAIAVTIATQLPKQLRRPVEEKYVPQFASTGY